MPCPVERAQDKLGWSQHAAGFRYRARCHIIYHVRHGLPCRKTWSLEAYIRPEYAKANQHVLLTVPYNLPVKKMRKSLGSKSQQCECYADNVCSCLHTRALRSAGQTRKAVRHWLRAGDLRSGYRRLVAACVVPLPFVARRI